MKNNEATLIGRNGRGTFSVIAAASALLLLPLAAGDEEIEWSPGEGYHEEEWYDPSDWFNDDDRVDYEYEYSDDDYYDGYWDGYAWYEDFDYGDIYGVGYVWDPELNQWSDRSEDESDSYSAKYSFDESSSDSSPAGSQNAEKQGGPETLAGTIKDFRKVDISQPGGLSESHALARIELESGKLAVVDLGLAALVSDDVKAGDKVTLRGSSGKIGGKDVFVATKLTAEGNTVFIDRAIVQNQSGPQSEMTQSQRENARSSSGQRLESMNQGAQFVLEGEIAEAKTARLSGKSEPQHLAKIRLQNGQAATVNLGPESSLQELDLEKGDRVRIEGRIEQVNGQNIVAAQSIRIEGENVSG